MSPFCLTEPRSVHHPQIWVSPPFWLSPPMLGNKRHGVDAQVPPPIFHAAAGFRLPPPYSRGREMSPPLMIQIPLILQCCHFVLYRAYGL